MLYPFLQIPFYISSVVSGVIGFGEMSGASKRGTIYYLTPLRMITSCYTWRHIILYNMGTSDFLEVGPGPRLLILFIITKKMIFGSLAYFVALVALSISP